MDELHIRSLDPATQRKIASWPALDQDRFRAGRLTLPGRGRKRTRPPRPSSLRGYIDSYTRGLKWLEQNGLLDPNCPPEERWTRSKMQAYVDESANGGKRPLPRGQAGRPRARHTVGLADPTLRTRVIGVWRILYVMAPKKTLGSLLSPLSALSRKSKKKSKEAPDWEQLARCSRKIMEDALRLPPSRISAIAFRTGLQIALLADLGLRLANFSQLEEGRKKSLAEHKNIWWVVFEASVTKNRRVIEKGLDPHLIPYLMTYKNVYRPILCAGRYGTSQAPYQGDRLWVSRRGQPQSIISIYKSVVRATQEHLARPVGPHEFRHAIATARCKQDPLTPSSASVRLNNTPDVVARHYNHASTREANRIAVQRLLSIGDEP